MNLESSDEVSVVRAIVDQHLDTLGEFQNWHGITADNIREFLVVPRLQVVDPDDLETEPRPMWVVLAERRDESGYLIVFDPSDSTWGVAERDGDGGLVMVIGSDSLQDALEGM